MRAITLSFLLTLAACQSLPTGAHTSANSLDWAGVYQGIIPCADCEGIDTTLRLASDRTYQLSMTYLGKSTTPFSSAGSFEWRQDGRAIMLSTSDGTPRFYRVEENRLRQLDTQGEPIESVLAEKYVLRKVAAATLQNTYWKLMRLGTTSVVVAENQREPHFILHPDDKRVSGSGGCNRLAGTYTVHGCLGKPSGLRRRNEAAGLDHGREAAHLLDLAHICRHTVRSRREPVRVVLLRSWRCRSFSSSSSPRTRASRPHDQNRSLLPAVRVE